VAEGGWAGQLIGIDTDLPVPPFIPVMFAVLFGLSMDYEVFLMSRIKEELAKGGDARMAVVAAVARTAKVITAAALIMVAVFAAFVLSPEVFLKHRRRAGHRHPHRRHDRADDPRPRRHGAPGREGLLGPPLAQAPHPRRRPGRRMPRPATA
jgi:hypothetical protein